MSIKEMISEHPQVGADYNEQLGEAVKHALYGAAIMNSCADACLAEENAGERAQCIRTCLDASDACTAFYRMASRRTGRNVPAIKAIGAATVIACEQCLAECESHTDAHCKRCAQMCREVIEDVKKAVQGLD
ncbi:four-helix bundle copper-binding protein [Erythrobacter sp. LQ02-29]|uniref:four-helix bundle copper-binding protein n=1 Tax=unclassified Erythrobacter TaxID=2633097 RepID=UPI001BFC3734|nr:MULTISPECIES: four-helix bundle copper-binding protein [unclassified Erythrobacter]MCP9222287.1 four-helix bundle copper-binding protein [Erythrobacter sp. LQ02-29]QWC56410.1 four-helix bundle copper-binding protein [Erythrobacter sp. 3-20A1M]